VNASAAPKQLRDLWTAGLQSWLAFVWKICKAAGGSRPPVKNIAGVLLEERGA